MTLKSALAKIQRMDPDGWATEPRAEDYEAFDLWVIETFGHKVFNAYLEGEWDR